MKIAVFTDSLLSNEFVSGVDISIKDTINIFKKRGHEVCVFAPCKEETSEEEIKRDYWKGIPVYRIPSKEVDLYPNAKNASLYFKQIRDIIKKNNFDIFHVHTPLSVGCAGLLISKLENIPIVSTFHTRVDEYFFYYILRNETLQKLLGDFGKKTIEQLIKFYFSKCDCTITPTKTLLFELKRKGFKHLVQIPNGINLKKFKHKNCSKLKKELEIPKNTKIILYLGRIGPEKKIDVLIKAFSNLKQKAYLVIAGEGPSLKRCRELVKKEDIENVIFTGFVPDNKISFYYSLADIFVSASDTETQGITFLEAMACGKPVIATKTAGGVDLIRNYWNGLLVEPGNYLELSKKIDYLLRNDELRKKMGRRNLDVVKKYGINEVSRRLLNLYKNVIDKTKGKERNLKFLKIFDLFTREKTVFEKIAMGLVVLVVITSVLFAYFRTNPNQFYLTTYLILSNIKQSLLKVLSGA